MTKRRVFKIVGLLLLGAIVNVAVAWGCAVLIDATHTNADAQDVLSSPNGDWHLQIFQRVGSLLYVCYREGGEHANDRELGRAPKGLLPEWCDQPFASLIETGSAVFETQTVDARGLPLPCMWSERIRWAQVGMVISEEINGGVSVKAPSRIQGTFVIAEDARVIPLRLILPYFVLNTITYATILWLLFAVHGVVRRRTRSKHGQCPTCGYPVGTNEVCTECGKRLPTRAAR